MKWVQTERTSYQRDCVVRAISLVLKISYDRVELALIKEATQYHSARYKVTKGCYEYIYRPFLRKKGWSYRNLCGFHCHMDNAEDHLPRGRIIVNTPDHLAACIKHTIYDTWDSRTKNGKGKTARPIYGYYYKEK